MRSARLYVSHNNRNAEETKSLLYKIMAADNRIIYEPRRRLSRDVRRRRYLERQCTCVVNRSWDTPIYDISAGRYVLRRFTARNPFGVITTRTRRLTIIG